MFKYVLFACIVYHHILRVKSTPSETIPIENSESVSPSMENLEEKASYLCPCMANDTSSFMLNIQPSPSIPSFEWKCNIVAKKSVRDDYKHVPGLGYYKIHTKAKPWNSARNICIREGGQLAVVNSIAEATAIVELFNKSDPIKEAFTDIQFHVGIHDLYTEGDWTSIHGDPLEKTGYNVWTDMWGGQPDDTGGTENCGTMVHDGKFDDVGCGIFFAFACEIPES